MPGAEFQDSKDRAGRMHCNALKQKLPQQASTGSSWHVRWPLPGGQCKEPFEAPWQHSTDRQSWWEVCFPLDGGCLPGGLWFAVFPSVSFLGACGLRIRSWYWRDGGSVLKSTCCSFREQSLVTSSQHCNSTCRESSGLLWPLRVPGMHVVHICTCSQNILRHLRH